MINMATTDILEEMGCRVTAFLTLKPAFAALEQGLPGAAVLDVNIGDATSIDLAELLRARGVPVVFLTGYDLHSFGPKWSRHPSCQKPCDPAALKRSLIEVVTVATNGRSAT